MIFLKKKHSTCSVCLFESYHDKIANFFIFKTQFIIVKSKILPLQSCYTTNTVFIHSYQKFSFFSFSTTNKYFSTFFRRQNLLRLFAPAVITQNLNLFHLQTQNVYSGLAKVKIRFNLNLSTIFVKTVLKTTVFPKK